MRIQIQVQGDKIVAARLETYGCDPATGRSFAELGTMGPARLERELGGLPPRRRFCARLAMEALCAAVVQAQSATREEVSDAG